ncbi:MAG TPA: sigma-70 family RNA polymerase sigma factor [Terriglobales bacterium]|nr:sigma-70 family RNA polymerase sigma factor [Terriglobales bacterium]
MNELCAGPKATSYPDGLILGCPPGIPQSVRAARVDDTLLIRQAQQGDKAAFEELVRHYDGPVLRLALHLTRSAEDAQDIYQEAFLRAYLNLVRFRFECSFYTWIYRIVTNLCLDHLRKNQIRNRRAVAEQHFEGDERNILDQVPDIRPMASPERTFRNHELRRRIGEALSRLSPRERMIFELRHYQGVRLQTVAVILNTTENTVKNTLFRAKHKMQTYLADVYQS